MSLLESIKKKKDNLVHTDTLWKSPDGQVFIEDLREGSRQFKYSTHAFVVDMKPDLEVGEVLGGLLIGSQDVAQSQLLLLRHNVTHILSLGIDIPKFPSFQYSYVEALDTPDFCLLNILPITFKIIDSVRKNRKIIYVHCNAGISRSASVVIGYLMKECDMDFKTAYAFLKSKRSSIKPNEGFERQLLAFEEDLKTKK